MGSCCSVSDDKMYPGLVHNNNIRECVICRDDLDMVNYMYVYKSECCKSEYHIGCILEWLKKQNTCPVCRRSINI